MPLPGWDHPILQRRRDAMREAVTSYLPLPARRAATRSTPVWTWFTRVALWVGIGMLVAVFAIATDPTKVAVVRRAGHRARARPRRPADRLVVAAGAAQRRRAGAGSRAPIGGGPRQPRYPGGRAASLRAPVLGGCPAEPAPFRRGAATAGGRGHHARQHPLPRRAAANLGPLASHLQRHPPQPLARQGRRLIRAHRPPRAVPRPPASRRRRRRPLLTRVATPAAPGRAPAARRW